MAAILTLLLPVVGHGETQVVLTELTDPSMIECADQFLYVLDSVTVYVYSLKDCRFIRKFGKRGEGPAELLPLPDMPICMQIKDNQVFLNSSQELIIYTRAGKMLEETRLPKDPFQLIPMDKKYAQLHFWRMKGGSSQSTVAIYDSEFTKLKQIFHKENLNDYSKGKIAFPFKNIYLYFHNDILYLVDQGEGFCIRRYDLNGEPLTSIKKNYPPIRMTDRLEKKFWEWLKIQPGFKSAAENVRRMVYFTRYLPTIRNMQFNGERIFVQTYTIRGNESEFVILDLEGNELGRLYLPAPAMDRSIRISPAVIFYFYGDSYYYLQEDMDSEHWELHRLNWTERVHISGK
jgi:hypothetical protein